MAGECQALGSGSGSSNPGLANLLSRASLDKLFDFFGPQVHHLQNDYDLKRLAERPK